MVCGTAKRFGAPQTVHLDVAFEAIGGATDYDQSKGKIILRTVENLALHSYLCIHKDLKA